MSDEPKEIEKKESVSVERYNAAVAEKLWHQNLTTEQKHALTSLCLHYGLEPLTQPINILGGNMYINRSGLAQIAGNSDDPPLSIILSPATKDERECSGVPDGEHYWKCTVTTTKGRGPFIEYGHANAKNVNLKNAGWREYQDMAKTRAYCRTMRLVYNIGITSYEEVDTEHLFVHRQKAETATVDLNEIRGKVAPVVHKEKPPAEPTGYAEGVSKDEFEKDPFEDAKIP